MSQEELQREFIALCDAAIDLLVIFRIWNDLFKSDNVKILEKSAGWLFWGLQAIIREHIILLVCRLTDPPKTFGKANLTIPRMIELLREYNCSSPEIETLSTSIISYGNRLRPVRNQILAHKDHEAYFSSRTLGKHTEEEMIKFFEDDLIKYFDAVGEAIGVGRQDLHDLPPGPGDVDDLIETLKKGLGIIPIRD